MAKKFFFSIFSLCTILIMQACGNNSDETDGTTGATEQTDEGNGTGQVGGKMLVVYFSRAGENWQVGIVERGNTAIMADYIKELAKVDVFEIQSENSYPSAYNEMLEVATNEINSNMRPSYKGDVKNIADYQTIFIGGPIWWARPPMIFRTFFEAHPELNGKTIVPFGTHGGSGIGSYTVLIREYFPNATVLESLGINGADIRKDASKTEVGNWLKKLGLDRKDTK